MNNKLYTYKYYLIKNNKRDYEDFEFISSWPIEDSTIQGDYYINNIAKDAAEYHFNHNEGYLNLWPQIFVILDKENKELGRYKIDVEYQPQFYASKIEQKNE